MWKIISVLCLIQVISVCNGQREACFDFCQANNPDDRFKVGSKRMLLIHKEDTWSNAKDHCERIGMRLSTPSKKEYSNELGAYLNRRVQGELPSLAFSYWNLWISLSDTKSEGNYTWTTTGEALSDASWASGEPNGGTGENCVEISWANKGGIYWNDSPCASLKRYICEIVELGLD